MAIFTHTIFNSSFKQEATPPSQEQLSFKSFPHIVKRPLFVSVKNYFHLLILLFLPSTQRFLIKTLPSRNNTPEVSICKCSMRLERCFFQNYQSSQKKMALQSKSFSTYVKSSDIGILNVMTMFQISTLEQLSLPPSTRN